MQKGIVYENIADRYDGIEESVSECMAKETFKYVGFGKRNTRLILTLQANLGSCFLLYFDHDHSARYDFYFAFFMKTMIYWCRS